MTMTRKDFEAIAQAIIDTYPLAEDDDPATMDSVPELMAFGTWSAMRSTIADVCAASNPRFDHEKFLARTDCAKRDRVTQAWKG
jgi:hypothetical protein